MGQEERIGSYTERKRRNGGDPRTKGFLRKKSPFASVCFRVQIRPFHLCPLFTLAISAQLL